MRKKDNKVYTVNKWNKPLFMQDTEKHLFGGEDEDTGQMEQKNASNPNSHAFDLSSSYGSFGSGNLFGLSNNNQKYNFGSTNADWLDVTKWAPETRDKYFDYQFKNYRRELNDIREQALKPNLGKSLLSSIGSYGTSAGAGFLSDTVTKKLLGKTVEEGAKKAGTKFLTNMSNALGASKLSSAASAGVGMAGTVVGTLGKHLISDGFDTTAGNLVADIGGLVGTGVGFINPVIGAIVSGATGLIGGAVNRAFGMKTDQGALKSNKEAYDYYNKAAATPISFDDIQGLTSYGFKNPYEGGWFREGEADEKNEAAQNLFTNAKTYAQRGQKNSGHNLSKDLDDILLGNWHNEGGQMDMGEAPSMGDTVDSYSSGLANSINGAVDTGLVKLASPIIQRRGVNALKRNYQFTYNNQLNELGNTLNNMQDNLLANYMADGGMIDTMNNDNDMGAIEYGFVSDLLSDKKMKAEQNNQMTNLFAGTPRTIFDLGGDIQMHGADYTTGLTHVNAGQSHELNPNDGVQMGVDPEGVPNLVEEGETVFNDYVYSNRILADEATKQKFHLPKKKDITFAEISKKLEKESSERPNDPISEAGLKAMLSTLADEQERQKQEMEAERAKAAFEALSPEEQTAVMQRAAQEEAIAQQAAQQQAMAEQAAQENAQISPEQAAMLQQQAMQADGSQAAIGQQPQVMAEGGHLFKDGGKKNQGAWKDDKENHWDKFTKPGLLKYIESIKERLDKAGSEKEKNAIRNEAAKEFNALQKSYFENVVPTRGAAHQVFDEGVYSHQGLFDNMFGNTGFYSTDEKGNRKNLIEEAINMPKGHNTDDKPDHWIDGYNGPRTSIRNFGSTKYGDDEFYKTLVDKFKEIGLDYAPNDEWTYDDNELYGLSVPDVAAATRADEGEPELVVDYGDANGELSGGTVPAGDTAAVVDEDGTLVPVKNPTWMRYAGLFGPAVGLGMQLAGVGKPDTSGIDAAIASANSPVHTADWMPIGNYLTYRPFDRLFHNNELLGTSRGTERALLNTNSPSRNAGLLANSYNTMVALGKLAREGEEYNDALEKQVEEFNRGTNMFNAQAYNQNQQFNASERNRARQYGAQTALQGAAQKMDADAGWNNSLYGNVAGLFKGIGDIGNENMAMNWRNALATSGAMGIMDEDLLEQDRMAKRVRKTADGGKLKKKKKGLTI